MGEGGRGRDGEGGRKREGRGKERGKEEEGGGISNPSLSDFLEGEEVKQK